MGDWSVGNYITWQYNSFTDICLDRVKGGLLHYITHICMCRTKGYGVWIVLVLKRVYNEYSNPLPSNKIE